MKKNDAGNLSINTGLDDDSRDGNDNTSSSIFVDVNLTKLIKHNDGNNDDNIDQRLTDNSSPLKIYLRYLAVVRTIALRYIADISRLSR